VRRLAVIVMLSACMGLAAPPSGVAADFRDDWALPAGFDLRIDSEGYELPTAIAFVPNPGRDPSSPLYFVAELRGRIKVVTRDRSVSTFADIGIPSPRTRYPDLAAQNGAAGLCLDPERGYVFATYSAFGPDGALRNAIVRFESAPRTFGSSAGRRLDVKRIFAAYPTSANHQIGGCVVVGDSLFVGVGDGAVATRARDLDSVSGKVLRMSLDGKPHAGNPFAASARPGSGRPYVWAYGLRNPFGLTTVGNALFATHNGNAIDSFLRIERGEDYGWNGTDAAIGANAEAVMNPAVGPVHVAHVAKGAPLFPAVWTGRFFFGASVSSADQRAGVLALGYDVARGWVTEPARSFVRFRRPSGGEVAGVALGPDGLYFAPILPNLDGLSAVYRVVYDPGARYPHALGPEESGEILYGQYGCSGCHSLRGIGGTVGPPLDLPVLRAQIPPRLATPEYRDRVAELNRTDEKPFASYRDARRRVLSAEGDEQLAAWMTYRLLEPRFDDPAAVMPNLGLNRAQAREISDYLLGRGLVATQPATRGFSERAQDVVESKRFAGGFAAGLVLALGAVSAAWLAVRRRRT